MVCKMSHLKAIILIVLIISFSVIVISIDNEYMEYKKLSSENTANCITQSQNVKIALACRLDIDFNKKVY